MPSILHKAYLSKPTYVETIELTRNWDNLFSELAFCFPRVTPILTFFFGRIDKGDYVLVIFSIGIIYLIIFYFLPFKDYVLGDSLLFSYFIRILSKGIMS